MQYVVYFNDREGTGTLSRNHRIEVGDKDADPRETARQWIAENDRKNGYRKLSLTGLARVEGGRYTNIPIN